MATDQIRHIRQRAATFTQQLSIHLVREGIALSGICLEEAAFLFFINSDSLQRILSSGEVSERSVDLEVVKSYDAVIEDRKNGKLKGVAKFAFLDSGFYTTRAILVTALTKAIDEALDYEQKGALQKHSKNRSGRQKQPHIELRREIVRRHAQKKSDLDNSSILKPLLTELDSAEIPLPKRRGAGERRGGWVAASSKPSWSTIRESLKKDVAGK